jgi:glycosyltransferase involved in cell wall biosynthesis
MKIVHDFFSQYGGGENLVTSISEMLKADIITAFNSKKKIKYIKESIFRPILKQSTFFVFMYFFFIFKVTTKESILFSGNHCCYSIKRCKGSKKFLYAHSLPKSLFSNLYLDHNSNYLLKFFYSFLKDFYKDNLYSLDKIIFNSKKTKQKFLHIFPDLEKRVALDVLYPFSNMPLINRDLNRTKISKYFVINSRHQASKNIEHIFVLISDFLKSNKDIKIYLTHGGELSKNLKIKNSNKNIIFTGYLDTFKYMELLSNSIGVIFPSRDEDFGISALDAYNLNIPVIVQRNCGFSEILPEDYNFFYNDLNLVTLLEDISKNYQNDIYFNKVDYKKLFSDYLNSKLS